MIESVERFPDTGSNRFRSALPIALLPLLKANAPVAFTCTVTFSDLPVHGTPGNALLKRTCALHELVANHLDHVHISERDVLGRITPELERD